VLFLYHEPAQAVEPAEPSDSQWEKAAQSQSRGLDGSAKYDEAGISFRFKPDLEPEPEHL